MRVPFRYCLKGLPMLLVLPLSLDVKRVSQPGIYPSPQPATDSILGFLLSPDKSADKGLIQKSGSAKAAACRDVRTLDPADRDQEALAAIAVLQPAILPRKLAGFGQISHFANCTGTSCPVRTAVSTDFILQHTLAALLKHLEHLSECVHLQTQVSMTSG